MSPPPKFHIRAGSRTALVSVGQLPVIDENSNTIFIQSPSATAPTPLAVLSYPERNTGRSTGPHKAEPPNPYIVGFLDFPPAVLTGAECKDEVDEGDEETVVGQMTPVPRVCSGDKRWKTGGLQRRCHVVLVAAVVLVVVVGLAVGLAFGLTKPETRQPGQR